MAILNTKLDQHFDRLPRDDQAFALGQIAVNAGAVIMQIYDQEFDVNVKGDGSPLTEADLKADALIHQSLARLAPHIPILSEEIAETIDPDSLGSSFFVVDPLDGTKEFVSRNGEFSVNIALAVDGKPTLGAVYAPALDTLWVGGQSAWKATVKPGAELVRGDYEQMAACAQPSAPIRAVASRSHSCDKTEAFLQSFQDCEKLSIGSALKFCLIAEGNADIYPRFGPTMVWDTAAGTAVLNAAGGHVTAESGDALAITFGKDGWRNGPFTAWGCKSLQAKNRPPA